MLIYVKFINISTHFLRVKGGPRVTMISLTFGLKRSLSRRGWFQPGTGVKASGRGTTRGRDVG